MGHQIARGDPLGGDRVVQRETGQVGPDRLVPIELALVDEEGQTTSAQIALVARADREEGIASSPAARPTVAQPNPASSVTSPSRTTATAVPGVTHSVSSSSTRAPSCRKAGRSSAAVDSGTERRSCFRDREFGACCTHDTESRPSSQGGCPRGDRPLPGRGHGKPARATDNPHPRAKIGVTIVQPAQISAGLVASPSGPRFTCGGLSPPEE